MLETCNALRDETTSLGSLLAVYATLAIGAICVVLS